jgi:hypothetical protein
MHALDQEIFCCSQIQDNLVHGLLYHSRIRVLLIALREAPPLVIVESVSRELAYFNSRVTGEGGPGTAKIKALQYGNRRMGTGIDDMSYHSILR